jgi:hypothetical protein
MLRTSLDLIRAWSESRRLAREHVRAILSDLRQRGSYEPARGHALRTWWDEVMG